MAGAPASSHTFLATAHLLGFSITIPTFPGIGDAWIVGALFLAHIALAEFSVGAITLAAAMEGYGLRSGSPDARRYARAAANSYYLVFSLGATFAIFAVVALVGLFGNGTGTLVNRFLPLVGLAFGLFIVLAPLLVWYRNSFGRMRDRNHFILGCIVAAWQTLFVVLIVGLDGFLITPDNASFASVLNPTYVPAADPPADRQRRLDRPAPGRPGHPARRGGAPMPRSTSSSSGRPGSISGSGSSPPC